MEAEFFEKCMSKLNSRNYYNIVIFVAECILLLIFLFSMMPIMNRVTDLSRMLFSFLICTSEDELKMVVSRTKRFMRIYLDKNMLGDLKKTGSKQNSMMFSIGEEDLKSDISGLSGV